MLKAISNTSPLLYLYRAGAIELLPNLFGEIWVADAVNDELKKGREGGYDVPDLNQYKWLKIVNPTNIPSEWVTIDLGSGELATIVLAIENPGFVVLLDDFPARRKAQAAGLNVWGTLRVLLESKKLGFVEKVEPFINILSDSGMWLSDDIKKRILTLAKE